jgi:hypothetical protein
MAKPRKQDITIGNGGGNPILAEKQSTAGGLKPSPPASKPAQNDTKPVSLTEALSLWQTACFDLQSYGFKTAILARDNRLYMIVSPPASIGQLTFVGGHLRVDGVPVSDL